MSLFTIETLYFVSLGIIFGLVILLIFHFRNKIIQLEKQVQSLHGVASELIHDMKESQRLNQLMPFTFNNDIRVQKCNEERVEEESDDDSDDSDDEEDDSDDEEELQQGSINLGEPISSDEIGFIVEQMEHPQIVVKEIEEEVEQNMATETQINKIDETTNLSLDEINMIEESVVSDSPLLASEDKPQITEEDDNATIFTERSHESTSINYKKMPVQKLREIAIERNLAPSNNKLKKEDLIRILKENTASL
jgi:hypothetical protein